MKKKVCFKAEAIGYGDAREYDIQLHGSVSDIIVDLGAIVDGVVNSCYKKLQGSVSYEEIKSAVLLASDGAKEYREKYES